MPTRAPDLSKTLDVVGGIPLRGTVALRGGKNAAIPMAIAALVSEAPTTLTAWPDDLGDIIALESILEGLGVSLVRADGSLTIAAPNNAPNHEAAAFHSLGSRSSLRSTPLLLTALLGRHGRGWVPLPGGCAIGERPIDVHLDCLKRLGANVRSVGGSLVATAARGLRGALLPVAHASTTGTQVAVLGAVLAQGDSEITGANLRSENLAFCRLLNALGAMIDVDPLTATIRVRGGLSHRAASTTSMAVPPSLDEAATWWVAGLMTGGAVTVTPATHFSQSPEVALLVNVGARAVALNDGLCLESASLSAFEVEVGSPPAIGSDLHPILAALATRACGTSLICDRRFSRHAYALQARKLGALFRVDGPTIAIDGPASLLPGDVTAHDLRGGMALLLLALAAPGRSRIRRLERIERGYGERLVETLSGLGADVRRSDPAVSYE